ncbi:aprataxin and PNK-like factor [Anoplophora glabripennis]|uniref:aprataxin and PNK-like factor n=1 Tax=Anoplophora glabripennis TaxID=217634 RepID=UPI000874E7C4|nr:aprataxin and PNK-like factor [Anoplophora glabripennis]
MTLLKIFSLGDVKEEDAFVLSEGQHVIGRGVLNCYDKRISRKHALIKICNNTVTIKAIHVNPCFFKSANGSNVMILPKDASVVLNQGDQFAFLASFFWFKVKVIKDDKRVDFTSEIVQDVAIKNNIDHHSHKVEAINSVDVDINYISSRVKRSHNDENLITKRRKISCKNINSTKQINTSSDELIRPSTSVNYSFYTPPKVKTESLAQTIVEDYVNQNDTNVSQEIKEGSSCTENGKGCSFTTKTEILDNIKIESNSIKANDLGVNNHVLENDDIGKGTTNDHIQKIPSGETSCTKNKNTAPSSMNNGNKNYKRPRCWYGYSCYR